MRTQSRASIEHERQQRDKRLFLTVSAIGFTGAAVGAVALGHRRAHRAAKAAGETITNSQVNWAFRAFGLGTLYAFSLVGCGMAVGSYVLQQRGVTTVSGFAEHMRAYVGRWTGGSMGGRLRVERSEDAELLGRADRWLDSVDEEAAEKKIRFSRIKALVNNGQHDPAMSVGARMRAFFGFK
ncbi:hypothetical protein IWW50_005246 [Coemansia erecta]|nr:hypothetical protein GGF43_005388 [Coemansia sp. RSA 2618]KAJ2819987.1 hypothetical protein IWW50_005246 [Coemansia erecta]